MVKTKELRTEGPGALSQIARLGYSNLTLAVGCETYRSQPNSGGGKTIILNQTGRCVMKKVTGKSHVSAVSALTFEEMLAVSNRIAEMEQVT